MIQHNYKGKVAVVTGGSGILGGEMAKAFLQAEMNVAILGRSKSKIENFIHKNRAAEDKILGLAVDVLDKKSLETAKEQILNKWGKIDILVNAAGGNRTGAIVQPEDDFFDLDTEAFDEVVSLNFKGTLLPTLVFGKSMSDQKKGCIINISSVAAQKPLTRVVGYAGAKAAIDNFTQWLAVEMATKYSPQIRVNAIAPGFFLSEQNHSLLLKEDGSLTSRGNTILSQTPMKRFGEPKELISTLLWLCSDASSFVTGITVHVDGGFSAFSGV